MLADPALQEGTRHHQVRQRASYQHHLSSPLAQTPYVVDEEGRDNTNISLFDKEYMRSHRHQQQTRQQQRHPVIGINGGNYRGRGSEESGERVYGQGSTTLLDDDEDAENNDGSEYVAKESSSSDDEEEEEPQLLVRRRRPSESLARSSSRRRPNFEIV